MYSCFRKVFHPCGVVVQHFFTQKYTISGKSQGYNGIAYKLRID